MTTNYYDEMYSLLVPENSGAARSQFDTSYTQMNNANARASRLTQLRSLQEQQDRAKLLDPNTWASMFSSSVPATTSSFDDRYTKLMDDPSYIQNTGAYKFRLGEGQRAIERSAAAKGMTGSGNTLAALLNYGQGAAQQAYDSEADRLLTMRGQDQSLQAQREAANLNARNNFFNMMLSQALNTKSNY